jgi:butanol dehydrogenase
MSVTNFTFDLPTRIIFGAGAVDSIGDEAIRCGQRALLVTGSTFARKSGLADRLQQSLAAAGVDTTLYESQERHPTVASIDDAGRLARERDAEFVVGFGGGRTLDMAKAVALAAHANRPIWEFARHSSTTPVSVDGALPLILIPIIASTGSETNDTAVVQNGELGIQAPIRSQHLFARAAIVDPTLTFTVPAQYTAVGAINIVSQMLETYVTSDEFAVTDRVSEGLVRVVMDSAARALRHLDDLDARSNLSWAATLASTVAHAGRAGTAPLRSLAYPLTARFGIDHGEAMSALWPSFIRYALGNRVRLPLIGRYKRYALLGRQIFGVHDTDDEVAAEITSYRLTSWLRGMEMPTDLLSFNLDPDLFGELAEQTVRVSGNGRRLPSGLTAEDVQNVYEGALRVHR